MDKPKKKVPTFPIGVTRDEVLEAIMDVFDYELKNYDEQLKFLNGNDLLLNKIQTEGINYSKAKIEMMRKYVEENLK